jgi:hypothetical protein
MVGPDRSQRAEILRSASRDNAHHHPRDCTAITDRPSRLSTELRPQDYQIVLEPPPGPLC